MKSEQQVMTGAYIYIIYIYMKSEQQVMTGACPNM